MKHISVGDRLTGEQGIQSASLSFCDGCGNLQTWNSGWLVIRDDFDYPLHFCQKHVGTRDELVSLAIEMEIRKDDSDET